VQFGGPGVYREAGPSPPKHRPGAPLGRPWWGGHLRGTLSAEQGAVWEAAEGVGATEEEFPEVELVRGLLPATTCVFTAPHRNLPQCPQCSLGGMGRCLSLCLPVPPAPSHAAACSTGPPPTPFSPTQGTPALALAA